MKAAVLSDAYVSKMASTGRVLTIKIKVMNRTLLEDLHQYFSKKELPSEQEKDLHLRLTGELPFSKVTSVSRDDLNIPLKETLLCPFCNNHPAEYDVKSGMSYCTYCETDWSDFFVLVEYPDDASYFEQEDVGYLCFNSEDNGARYIPEYEYIKKFKRHPKPEQLYSPVSWPDSQEYLDHPLCEAIIADEKALKDFGSASLWMPHKLYQDYIIQ
ncbi:MAG: hypothetical protein LBV74_02120 [Tannerella sp.]|nr:hypothetical protein [Tannerella sp.]